MDRSASRGTDARGLVDVLASAVHGTHHPTVAAYDRRTARFAARRPEELVRSVVAEAVHLRQQGVQPGDVLLLAASTPLASWSAYLASVVAGAVPALLPHRPGLDSTSSRSRLGDAIAAVGSDARLYGSRSSLGIDASRAVEPVPAGFAPSPAAIDRADLLARPSPASPVHIQLSSGSTARPKAVVVTHGSLQDNAERLRRGAGLDAGSRMLSWLPLYHDMGLVLGCITPLLAGADVFLMSPVDFLRDPMAWIRSAAAVGATHTAGPDSALRTVLERAPAEPLGSMDLTALRFLCCGGEPVGASTVRDFERALAPAGLRPGTVAPGYGLAEATVGVSLHRPSDTLRRVTVPAAVVAAGTDRVEVLECRPVSGAPPAASGAMEVVSVGRRNLAPADIRAVGTDEVLGAGRLGEIVVTGPSVTAGYLQPDGTIDAFGGIIRTGDLGFIHEGELYVVDRLKNVIIRNGQNHSAVALEQALAAGAGLAPGRLLVLDSDLRSGHGHVVAVVDREDEDPDELIERIRAAGRHVELPPEEVVVVKQRSLPRTTSGKKQHGAVRQLLAADELRVLARRRSRHGRFHGGGGAQPAAPIEPAAATEPAATIDVERIDRQHRVLALVERAARAHGSMAEVTLDAALEGDLLIDSLGLFEVAVQLERDLGVGFADDDLHEVRSVRDLVERLERARGRAATARAPGERPPDGADRTEPAASGLAAAAERLAEAAPGVGLVVQAQKDRQLLVDGRWLADLASCNYLGLDLDAEVQASIEPAVRRWGVHPSWTRAVASPQPYATLERELAELVGVTDTVVFATVSLLHFGVLPRLAGPGGALLLDAAVHHSVQEAAALARAHGSAVATFRHGDLDDLDRRLAQHRRQGCARGIVAVDGVYSMSGEIVDLPATVEVARRHDAIVYVDDAHGIGVLGRDPSVRHPYGRGGGGVVAHQAHRGVGYDHVVYVGGLSKAFSSMAAFVTCTAGATRRTFEGAGTMVFSGPVPVASLASALQGLRVSAQRGDRLRGRLHRLTQRLLDGLEEQGWDVAAHSGFPIVNVTLGAPDDVLAALHVLWDLGVVVTPSVFPATPLHAGGVRFTPTAANTEAEIDLALEAMAAVRRNLLPGDVPLRAAPAPG